MLKKLEIIVTLQVNLDNINFQLTKKIPVIFHNLKGYDSHLIFSELSKFN